MDTLNNKPLVRICAGCLKVDNPDYAYYDIVGVSDDIKKEIKLINQQIKDNRDKFIFSHGVCIPHLKLLYVDMPKKLPWALKQSEFQPGGPIPCLLTDEATRHAYMRGLFTEELVQQYIQSQQQAKADLTEHLKKLAGIH